MITAVMIIAIFCSRNEDNKETLNHKDTTNNNTSDDKKKNTQTRRTTSCSGVLVSSRVEKLESLAFQSQRHYYFHHFYPCHFGATICARTKPPEPCPGRLCSLLVGSCRPQISQNPSHLGVHLKQTVIPPVLVEPSTFGKLRQSCSLSHGKLLALFAVSSQAPTK